jgi:indolepyruvate decarboxylase
MSSSPPLTVGSFLFDYLYQQGVRCAFGIPGDFALPTFRWLDRSPLRLITMTHEPSVGFAADGYARVNGLGVAVVTYCVGGLNLLNAVACAYAEKSPVLVISGGPSPQDRKTDPLLHHKVRTFDTQRRIFEEVTCASAVLLDAATAPAEIMRVVQEVRAQCRPGYIEVPFDIVDLPVEIPPLRNIPPPESDRENLDACMEDATAFINAAQNPIIIADVELHRHGLTDLAMGIAEKFNIPIAATLLSKSVISEQNPLYLGVYSGGLSEPETQRRVEESDCVIKLGAFITDMFLGLNTAKLERKHCILATTEETRVGLRRYDKIVFREFLEKLLYSNLNRRTPEPILRPAPVSSAPVPPEAPVTIEAFFSRLSEHLPEGATLVCDTGDALIGASALRTSRRNNFLADAYYLSMGFAVPASIGAMAANPDSRAVVIVGDGAFQMTGIELSTVAKEGMHPVVIILNNDGYGTQRHIIDGTFNDIHPWDYPKLCELLRYGKAYRATTMGALEAALTTAMTNTQEMALIEVVVPRDDSSQALRRMGEALAKARGGKGGG